MLLLIIGQVTWCWLAYCHAWWPISSRAERAVFIALTALLAGHTAVNLYWFRRVLTHVGRHVGEVWRSHASEESARPSPAATTAAQVLEGSGPRRRRLPVG